MHTGLEHYQLGRLLSDGPLGAAHEGVERKSGRRVHVRILPPGQSAQTLATLAALRTKLEALSAAAALLVECGQAPDGAIFIVSPWIDGRCLRDELDQLHGQPFPDALELAQQLSALLARAHAAGLFHLALRPSQIILSPTGGVRANQQLHIVGLGLVSALGKAMVSAEGPVRSPFGAPEQEARRGHPPRPLDGRTDVFALGVLLWLVFTGSTPVAETLAPQDSPAAASAMAGEELPEHLAELLTRMIEPEPALRPSMDEVAAALSQINAGVFAPTMAGENPGTPGPVSLSPAAKAGFPVPSWDRYEFLGLLGRGGMGAVYKARDLRLGREVALKFIRGDDPAMISRFMQEARAQARIDHDNICKVYETGEIEGKPYIAMQLVAGKSLETAGTTMSLTQKILVMHRVAEAMHEAHRLGIIHRDLKPANIMVEYGLDGSLSPIVMDFGLARESHEERGLTKSGAIMGTPAYMAPEQARGEVRTIDRRADVYSLGATLYDLIAGTPPFDDESVVNLLLQVVNEDAKPLRVRVPSVPPDLETIVMKCLNKEPNNRYDSAKALAEDLDRYMNGEPIHGRRASLMHRVTRWSKKNRALFIVSALSFFVVAGLGIAGLRQYLVNKRERERIAAQARLEQELAQQLGQEIAKMEWALRSARQLSLHDLGREKAIVRRQMKVLQTGLANYGELGRGLAHYALGRGHMALHEYPRALAELEQAIQAGKNSADVQYALGFVLGKHFEQAIYDARLAGGGDWAKKQLKNIEPKYLTPAIESLKRSRAMKTDSPKYLEGLIAYYQRDYEAALKLAEEAAQETPWLYEAHKLAGDIHLERALQARDSGKYEEAEKEFSGAVKKYEAAADIGHSDAEVYEGLAEAWVRQIEMAQMRGQSKEAAYAAAIAASKQLTTAEPESIVGRLKEAFASMMTMGATGTGQSSMERVQHCLAAADAVLTKQPGHPYASEAAASCNVYAAEVERLRGGDPEPLLRKALGLMEPTVKRYPYFLWGLNDLGNVAQYLGTHLQLHGKPAAKETLQQSLEYFAAAVTLDPTYLIGYMNALSNTIWLVPEARTDEELRGLLTRSDDWLAKCKSLNGQIQQCYNNYFQVYVRAAGRALWAGQDPQPRLKRGLENLAEMRKVGGSLLDAEQHAALAHLIDATHLVRRQLDPGPALAQLATDLSRCFATAAEDAMCRTLAAQGAWVAADWAAQQQRPPLPFLQEALGKAVLSTQSPETYPDAWQTLAETHLRLARAEQARPKLRDRHISDGLAAAEKIFVINPNHALGRATQGALALLRAQSQPDAASRRAAAQAPVAAFEQAIKNDPFLRHEYAPLLAQAKDLTVAN